VEKLRQELENLKKNHLITTQQSEEYNSEIKQKKSEKPEEPRAPKENISADENFRKITPELQISADGQARDISGNIFSDDGTRDPTKNIFADEIRKL